MTSSPAIRVKLSSAKTQCWRRIASNSKTLSESTYKAVILGSKTMVGVRLTRNGFHIPPKQQASDATASPSRHSSPQSRRAEFSLDHSSVDKNRSRPSFVESRSVSNKLAYSRPGNGRVFANSGRFTQPRPRHACKHLQFRLRRLDESAHAESSYLSLRVSGFGSSRHARKAVIGPQEKLIP